MTGLRRFHDFRCEVKGRKEGLVLQGVTQNREAVLWPSSFVRRQSSLLTDSQLELLQPFNELCGFVLYSL